MTKEFLEFLVVGQVDLFANQRIGSHIELEL